MYVFADDTRLEQTFGGKGAGRGSPMLPLDIKLWISYRLSIATITTLCPNKSDPLADFLIACGKVYRIKHNFMNTYPYVLQTIMKSFWEIRLSVTQKSNYIQNRINV